MIERKRAIGIIKSHSKSVGAERLALGKCLGRVLAEDLKANISVPPFDSSAMDGFAMRSGDINNAAHKNPARLTVIGESRAGKPFRGIVGEDDAVKISTGAMIPEGADCVAMKETCREEAGVVSVFSHSAKGDNVFPEGEDIKRNSVILKKGALIRPQEAGVIASCGISKVTVSRKPTVSIVFTGDEVTEPGRPLGNGKIYNSNAYVIKGLLEGMGCSVKKAVHSSDKEKHVRNAIKRSRTDFIVVTGGVSVGEHDHVRSAFKSLGGREIFWKVQMKPGKPFFFGKLGKSLFFGLPGNPAACYVCIEQFIRPSVMEMLGRTWKRTAMTAALSADVRKSRGREYILRAFAENGSVHPLKGQSSGVLSAFLRANSFIIAPKLSETLRKGDVVEVELLE